MSAAHTPAHTDTRKDYWQGQAYLARAARDSANAKNDKLRAANAVLLAALLKVQTDMQRTDFGSDLERRQYTLRNVRAALAKAEGRS